MSFISFAALVWLGVGVVVLVVYLLVRRWHIASDVGQVCSCTLQASGRKGPS
jgi:hypothetical protein